MNIIHHLHRLSGLKDPIREDYNAQILLRGVKRELGTAQSPVDAITPQHLLQIKAALTFKSVLDHSFWCACLVAFYGLLRPGNFTVQGVFEPNKDLRRIDLLPTSWGYILQLRYSKTIQFREKVMEIILPRVNNALCPASALLTLLRLGTALNPDPLSPLFIVDTSRPMTYKMFMSVLGQCVLKSGIQARLSGHSFRRGGATWLSRLGVPLDIIKQLGYWSSDAVARYIEPNFSQKVSVMQSFGKSLP